MVTQLYTTKLLKIVVEKYYEKHPKTTNSFDEFETWKQIANYLL